LDMGLISIALSFPVGCVHSDPGLLIER